MKKIFALALIFSFICGFNSFAANGDVVGHIYSTDIRTYINGVEVPSYNIGGKTVVVVEDILNGQGAAYYDSCRTLVINSLAPDCLVSGTSDYSMQPGKVIGDIYETDIKTYIFNKELPSYCLDGKTAVEVRALGGSEVFSEIGGKCTWNEELRQAKLEFMYSDFDEYNKILWDTNAANIKIKLSDDLSVGNAEFYAEKYSVGGNISYEIPEKYGSEAEFVVPVTAELNGENIQLGYFLKHKAKVFEHNGYITADGTVLFNGYIPEGSKELYEEREEFREVFYLDSALIKKCAQNVKAVSLSSREQVIKTFILNYACSIDKHYDNDDYTFVEMHQGTPHGANKFLLLIQNDGSYHNYADDFESVSLYGTKQFDNVVIDEKNEKVYFDYDTKYVIDLKTGVLSKNN